MFATDKSNAKPQRQIKKKLGYNRLTETEIRANQISLKSKCFSPLQQKSRFPVYLKNKQFLLDNHKATGVESTWTT